MKDSIIDRANGMITAIFLACMLLEVPPVACAKLAGFCVIYLSLFWLISRAAGVHDGQQTT